MITKIVLNIDDETVLKVLQQRAAELRKPLEDVTGDALLRGVMQNPVDRVRLADEIRKQTLRLPDPGEDSVDVIRRMRDELHISR